MSLYAKKEESTRRISCEKERPFGWVALLRSMKRWKLARKLLNNYRGRSYATREARAKTRRVVANQCRPRLAQLHDP